MVITKILELILVSLHNILFYLLTLFYNLDWHFFLLIV